MDPHDSAATRQKGSNRDEVKEKMPLQRKWASEPSASTKQNTFCEPEVKHRESLPCGVMRGSAPQQKYPMTGNPVQLLSGPSVVGAIGGPPSADPHGPLTQGFPRGYPYQLGQPYPQHPQTERFISGAKPQPGLESHAWPFAGQLPSDDPYGHPGHTHLHRAGRFPRQKSPSLPSSFGQYSQSGLEPGEESYSKKEQKAKKPGKYICHYCGRACAKPSVLKKHIRSHTGERPYPCEPCGFSFKTKSNLYKHRKSHAHAIKAGLVPFSSELAVSHSEDVGQASPVGEGEAPSDGEQSTDTDEEGVEGSTMLMEKHSPIPQISFEANKTAGGGEPAYADSAEEFHIGSMKVPILIFPKPGVVPPGGMDCPTFHDVKMSHHMLTSQAGGRSHSLDDSATIKRLAQRMEDKKGQDSDTSISQSLNLLSPHSKGSTDSGYFSPYDSAELQIGTPNASAKTYEEIMFGRTWYNRPNSRSRQSMTVGMAGVEGNESLKQQDLEMCKIAEDHPSFRENLETSGDAKQYPTGPCQSNTGLLEPPSESGTLIRSRSMPAPVPSNLNTPQGIRGSISFDNMVAPDDVFYPPGQPKLKRQSAFEHPANESHTGEADGHTQMAKNLASSVGLKIAEGSPGGPDNIIYNQYPSKVSICEIATRKRRKEKSVGDDEDSPENCDSSCSGSVDMMGDYDFKQGSLDGSRATPTGKKSFHSAHSQSDSFDTCVSMCSEDIVLFSDSEGRKPAGNVISVIQHTNSLSRPNSFEKSESFEQPAYQSSDKAPSSQYSEQSDTDIYEDALSPESALLRAESMEQQQSDSDLASFSSSSAAASPGQAYHKLVRQPNIQVPEIRVTEEPDKPEKDTEPLVTKEPEKPPPAVEEFQLPQRSDTLSQMPTEKLPPKKKRLRLADLEYSSGESSFESTCTSLSRSPSQESNLSHSSSMSMSFEKDEGVKSVSPTKQEDSLANVSGAKQSEFLTVPSSFSSLHQQREMRRSSSEQAPCTLHTELPEMRSKSFDYGSLPSCRQGEIYTSASAKKERRRGYLVRQASLSVYPEAVQQDTGGGQVSIKQESLEHGVWPVPSGSPHSTSEMAARTRRPGTGSHHQPPQHVLQQSISDDSLQDEPCFGRPKQHRLQAQGSSSEGEHPALEVRNRDLIQQHQSGVPFATFSQPGGFWNQESEQVVSQQQFQKLHVRSSSSLPGPAAPTESVQQINDPQLYEEKTKHQGTHIYSPSFPSHMNMLKRHLQPTQNLSSKATLPGLLVPVRIQTYVPMFGRATYTSVSQFISSHGNEAEALGADRAENGHVSHLLDVMRSSPGGTSGFNLSLLLGQTDGDLLHSSFWKGSDNHLNTGIPLSLTSGTISTTDASGSVIGGGKRMLSPTSSLELFIQSKQQKRVKEERMYGQIVKEMGAVELSGAERGSKPGKQEGSYQGLPFSRKDSVDECEQMSSSPPLTDPPAATKIAVPVRSSAPHLSDVPLGDSFTPPLQIVTERSVSYSQDSPDRLDVDDVSPGPSSSPEPMLSSSDAENSDQQPLLLKPAPTQSSGMMGGAQSLLFANLSEVQQLLHFPSLRTASRVSWCFRNYTKPNSTQATSQCSVYSSWSVSTHNPNPLNISTKAALALLRSKQRKNTEWLFTLAAMCPPSSGKLVSSEAWKLMFDQLKPDLVSADLKCFGRKMKGVESWERSKVELGEKVVSAKHLSTEPTRIKIFEGGYKSNEDYVYVRGRGRGKYICEECGIRCKKPSMLKKHIRTHTDVRPYVCKFCNFAFKTKGNLTKHMKSKAHIKKCLELGVSMSSVEDTEAEEGDIPEDGRGSSEKSARDRSVEHQFSDADDSDGAEDDGDEVEDEDDEEDDYDGDSTPKTGSRSCSPQPYSLPLMSIAPVATSNPTPHRATDLLGTPPSPPLLGYFTTVPSIQITPQAQSSEAAGRERVRAEDHGGQLQPVGSRLLPPPSSSSMDEDIPDLSSRLSSPGLEPPGCPSPISPSSSPSTHRYLSPCRNLSPSSRHLSPRRDISPLRHISTAGGYRRDLSPRRRHAVVSPLSRPLSPRGRDYRRDLSPQGQQKGMMRHVSPCRGPPHQSQQGVVWGPRGAALLHPDLPVGTLQTCMQLEANHPSSSLLHREQDQRSNQNHLSSAPLQVLFSHLPLHSQFPMPSSLPLIPVGGIHMVSSAPTPINSCLAQQAEVSTVSCLTLQKTTSDDSNSGEANILHFSSSSKRRGPAEAQGVMEASSPQHREGCGVRLEQEEGIQTCTQAIASLCIDSGRGRSIGDEGKGGNASSSFCPFPPPLMTLGSMSSLLPQPSQSHQNPGNQHLSTQDLRPPPPTVSSSSHAPHSPVSPLASKPANPESE